MQIQPLPLGDTATVGDYRLRPGARFYVICTLCGWAKGYSPERVARRLDQLKIGGHAAPLYRLARHVAWPCPGCGRVKWRTALAYPPDLDRREAMRLARALRD